MPLRRSLAVRSLAVRGPGASAAAVAVSLFAFAPTSFAQTSPPATPAATPAPATTAAPAAAPATTEAEPGSKIRYALDLHGGLLYRVNSVAADATYQRGGGLVGANLWIAPIQYLALGPGYEHAFFGSTNNPGTAGIVNSVSRGFDTLWINARIYPWQNENVALFVDLAAGPTWQSADNSFTLAVGGTAGADNVAQSCSAYDKAGLALRGGIGAELHWGNLIAFTPQIGADHLRTSDGTIGGCVQGSGNSTFLAARIGFTLASGREKAPPPPPPIADTDADGIPDDKDACPTVPGVANPDPKKNGCPADRDNDGIPDALDACPDVPGVANVDPKKNGCPADRDGDGIPDLQDACPDVPGVADPDPKKNGCPADRDGDGIPDKEDACPDVPGVKTNDPKTNGCPLDTDGDGIPDSKDACPTVPGLPNEDPAKNGCPRVMVTEKEVVIGEEIQFDVDKATIKHDSDGLLDEIGKLIVAHPEIKKIEVQGHTDATGSKQHNKVLSGQRAESVKKALEKRGVKPRALIAKGYGQEKPIADNATDAGRAKNRRVQFLILEKGEPGAAVEQHEEHHHAEHHHAEPPQKKVASAARVAAAKKVAPAPKPKKK